MTGNNIPSDVSGPSLFGTIETATTITFTEGPTCDSAGNLYFSDVRGNRIMKLDRAKTLSVFRQPSNFANGMVCDPTDRLWICEESDDGTPRISRIDLSSGAYVTVVERIDGLKLRGPKDITYDSKGRIYFTDGSRPFFLGPFPNPEQHQPGSGVYRVDPDGRVTRILGPDQVQEPNGIGISPNENRLYVIENNPNEGGLRQLLGFDLSASGDASGRVLLHDFGIGRSGDGLSVDDNGRLWVAAGLNQPRNVHETLENPAGIYVFTERGTLLDILRVPEDSVTNNCFGGPDRRTLYITAGKTIYVTSVVDPGRPN